MRAAALLGCCLLGLVACELRLHDEPGPSGDTGVVDDDDGGPQGDRDCCSPHPGPECDNPIISSCVCDVDPRCCEDGWGPQCAALVQEEGCGQCGSPGDCCDARDMPGCEVPSLEACVCDADPVCCNEAWDPQCVADVYLLGCGLCPGASNCCVADGAPGCTEPDIQQCVCAEHPDCCAEAWDFACVQAVEALGCGTCSGTDDGGSDS